MKKIVIILLILVVLGYIIYQNGPLWALRLLSLTSGPSQNTPSTSGSTGPVPPYKDGTYTGNAADAFYGNIQVQATIQSGRITNVQFLQYPNDRTRSIAINTLAMPNLSSDAIQAQNANVNIFSGATDSSNAFIQSLSSALTQAK